MNKSEIFETHQVNITALRAYGFSEKDGRYIYKQNIDDTGLSLVAAISENIFLIKVYDSNTNEEYFPFNITYPVGSFIAEIRKKADKIIENIVSECFTCVDRKQMLLRYVKETYQIEPEYPWKKFPSYATLKTPKRKKWFGVIMTVPYKVLGIEKDGMVDVLNIKCFPSVVVEQIDNKQFFPAYHMNKKYWMTILLNQNISFDKIKALIDKSFQLVEM